MMDGRRWMGAKTQLLALTLVHIASLASFVPLDAARLSLVSKLFYQIDRVILLNFPILTFKSTFTFSITSIVHIRYHIESKVTSHLKEATVLNELVFLIHLSPIQSVFECVHVFMLNLQCLRF